MHIIVDTYNITVLEKKNKMEGLTERRSTKAVNYNRDMDMYISFWCTRNRKYIKLIYNNCFWILIMTYFHNHLNSKMLVPHPCLKTKADYCWKTLFICIISDMRSKLTDIYQQRQRPTRHFLRRVVHALNFVSWNESQKSSYDIVMFYA